MYVPLGHMHVKRCGTSSSDVADPTLDLYSCCYVPTHTDYLPPYRPCSTDIFTGTGTASATSFIHTFTSTSSPP